MGGLFSSSPTYQDQRANNSFYNNDYYNYLRQAEVLAEARRKLRPDPYDSFKFNEDWFSEPAVRRIQPNNNSSKYSQWESLKLANRAPITRTQPSYSNAPVTRPQANYSNAPVTKTQANYSNTPVTKTQVNYSNAPVTKTQANYSNAPATKTQVNYSNAQKQGASALISPKLPSPKPVIKNTGFINDLIYSKKQELEWDLMDESQSVLYVRLEKKSLEYQNIASYYNRTRRPRTSINKIERIQNPYLLAAYEMKKAELKYRFKMVNEKQLFHGTKQDYVDSICMNNFDWRLYGSSRGHKFGQGVSFSPKSSYSIYYCDEYKVQKVMLVALVLVASSCFGNKNMILPPQQYDTSQKPTGDVIVKYEDNEFYPAYKIYIKDLSHIRN